MNYFVFSFFSSSRGGPSRRPLWLPEARLTTIMPPSILLNPKPRRGWGVELPVLSDSVFESHRSSLLALSALLQGIFILLFSLFLRVPSCADVAGQPYDKVQALTLWTLQILGILLSLFSNNKYSSALWLLLALAILITEVLLLATTDFQYCSASILRNGGMESTVLSALSTALPSSMPRESLLSQGWGAVLPSAALAAASPLRRRLSHPTQTPPLPLQSSSLPFPPLWCC